MQPAACVQAHSGGFLLQDLQTIMNVLNHLWRRWRGLRTAGQRKPNRPPRA